MYSFCVIELLYSESKRHSSEYNISPTLKPLTAAPGLGMPTGTPFIGQVSMFYSFIK